MSKNTALIIGLGNIGMGYDVDSDTNSYVATFSKAFSLHPHFELVGAVDPDSSKRSKFQDKYNHPAYSSVSDALAVLTPDVIVIAVPTDLHYQVFNEIIAQKSPKIIICEKPIANSYEQAYEMVEKCEKNNILFFVNYPRRCDSAVINIKKRISADDIQSPAKGVCWYTKGILHNGSHFINLFQYWFGKVVDFEILKKRRNTNANDVEADVMINFEQGSIYFLLADENCFSYNTYDLLAQNGRLKNENGVIYWQSLVKDENFLGYTVLDTSPEEIKSEPLRLMWHVVDQLANKLKGVSSDICTGEEALSTLLECLRIKNESI